MLQLLYLLIAAEVIINVISPECPFVPSPTTASNDIDIIEVDCGTQGDVGLGDTTGDSTGLAVYLYNCCLLYTSPSPRD